MSRKVLVCGNVGPSAPAYPVEAAETTGSGKLAVGAKKVVCSQTSFSGDDELALRVHLRKSFHERIIC
jgi:hypothetical protein